MLPTPRADLVENTFDYEMGPLVKATGFRKYDARWLFGFTEPHLPDGWHAISPGVGEVGRGSAVVITE